MENFKKAKSDVTKIKKKKNPAQVIRCWDFISTSELFETRILMSTA